MSRDAIVSLIVAVLPFLVAGAGYLYRLLLGKLPENQRDQVAQVVRMAVAAVEQKARAELLDTDKRAAAEAMIVSTLRGFGIKVDLSVIDMLIEAEVSYLNENKPAPDHAVPMSFIQN